MPAEPRDISESTRAARASDPSGLPAIGYDAVPYPARAFPSSHPQHLATVATLLGLRPPSLEDCRVLELGCATGGNLVPMADDLASGRFVGLDLSHVQIEAARTAARKAGLKNVEFRCQDLLGFGAPGAPGGGPAESFDYIIAHGLYSWVPRGGARPAARGLRPAPRPRRHRVRQLQHLPRLARACRRAGDDADPRVGRGGRARGGGAADAGRGAGQGAGGAGVSVQDGPGRGALRLAC